MLSFARFVFLCWLSPQRFHLVLPEEISTMTTLSATVVQNASTVLAASSTSKLSEDYISSQNILLDLSSNSPVAVFQDYQGDTEAVAIRSDKQLLHLYRNWQQADTPWNVVEIGGTIQGERSCRWCRCK
jgi:hypothetical protein